MSAAPTTPIPEPPDAGLFGRVWALIGKLQELLEQGRELVGTLQAVVEGSDRQRWVTLEDALERVPMNREDARQLIKARCRTLSRGRRVLVWLPSLENLADTPQPVTRKRTRRVVNNNTPSWEDA